MQERDEHRRSVPMRSGVVRMVTISTRVRKFERIWRLPSAYPSVFCSVGTHPAQCRRGTRRDRRRSGASGRANAKVVAIGEAGLDYFYDTQPPEDAGRPVSGVTSRRRGAPAAAGHPQPQRRRRHGGDPDRGNREGGLSFHSALLLVGPGAGRHRRGAGRLCFLFRHPDLPEVDELRDIAATVPMDRLLVETDAPYLAPKRWRGKRNEPSYVVNTAEVLAEVKGVGFDEIAPETTENALPLFSKMPRHCA
jgi:TatD DNase family protein